MMFVVFQTLVRLWVVRAFGEEVANDRTERTHRFLEEALELAQSTGCTQEHAHALVEYVYGRPMGVPGQEVGGTLLTLAALCSARGIAMDIEASAEIARVNKPEILDKIRLKQEAKKRDIPLSPLPGPPAAAPLHRLCGRPLLDVRTNSDNQKWWCPLCKCDVAPADIVSAKPSFQPPGQGAQTRTFTDAVGTDGCKATVARKI